MFLKAFSSIWCFETCVSAFSSLSHNSNGVGFRWWAPSKFDPVKSPMLFFEKGKPLVPPVPPDVGIDKVLNHMVWCYFLS